MVEPEIIMLITPAQETDASRSLYMEGQAEPSRESGSPRLINAR